MIKQVYKTGEYFLRPHTIKRFSCEKQSRDFIGYRGLLPLPLLGEEVTSQAYQGWYCGFAIDLLFALGRNRNKQFKIDLKNNYPKEHKIFNFHFVRTIDY